MIPVVGTLVSVRKGTVTFPCHVEELDERRARGEVYGYGTGYTEGPALVLRVPEHTHHIHPNPVLAISSKYSLREIGVFMSDTFIEVAG